MNRIYYLSLIYCLLLFYSCNQDAFNFDALFGKVGSFNIIMGNSLMDSSQYPIQVALPLIVINDGKELKIDISLSATDLFDCQSAFSMKSTLLVPDSAFVYETNLPLTLANGYYHLQASLTDGTLNKTISTEIGIVPPPVPGLRKDSFFASNTSYLRTGEELDFLQLIGIKVQRTHIQPNQNFSKYTPSNSPLPLDFSEEDKRFRASVDHGIWVLPIVGYAFNGTRSPLAQAMNMYGPPRHFDEFVQTWKTILRHYPNIDTYEFWNEPWIFGWTWADDAAAYRLLQNKWIHMAHAVNPGIKIIAGNSCMFVEDHLELFPQSYNKSLTGISHHPYTGANSKTMRQSGQVRSIDYGYLTNRRLGLERYYLTEGGTSYRVDYSAQIDSIQKQISSLSDMLRGFSAGDEYISFIERYGAIKKDLYNIENSAERNSELLDQLRTEVRRIFGQKNRHTEEFILFCKCWTDINEETDVLFSLPDPQDNNMNVAKCIQYMVHASLSGVFQENMQWNIGYGPDLTRSNTAIAVFSHFIEDRPVVADIWPNNELIYGAIYANPRQITPEVCRLSRAKELESRWHVQIPEERNTDSTLIAVLFSITGPDYNHIDKTGSLLIKNAEDIKAFDITGRQIPKTGNRLCIPFNQFSIYLTTNKLSIMDFKKRIAEAESDALTPINFYAYSLFKQADIKQKLQVRIENQFNRSLSGKLWLQLPDSLLTEKTDFQLKPAELATVNILWPGSTINDLNMYPVTIFAKIDGRHSYQQKQILSTAAFARISAVIDADLSEWKNELPVVIDSDLMESKVDLGRFLLNPGLSKPDLVSGEDRIVAKVYTGYDSRNIYIAAEVFENQLHNKAGEVFSVNGVLTEYRQGMPAGFNHIRFTGDALIFAFGFRDRVPGWGRQMNDPYAWKGQFYDSDYTYAAHISTQGDQLIRLWGKNTSRRNAYQGVNIAGVGPVPGANIRIRRDINRACSIYEMSIPRKEIDLFNPKADSLRFAFIIANDEGLGSSGVLSWPQAAGVFDYWCSSGSFGPTWQFDIPCQTFWGIHK